MFDSYTGLLSPVAKELLRVYFPDLRIYVFGSYARNGNKPRDLDIILVSISFEELVIVKRHELVQQLLDTSALRIDPICLTPMEMTRLLCSTSAFASTVRADLLPLPEQDQIHD